MTTPSPTTSSESLGQTLISEKVVARIVSAAADSVPGTTRQTRSLDNITARRYPRFDVEVDNNAGTVFVEAYIAVLWPAPVTAVAARVRDTITAWVERLTHFSVSKVNVVTGPVIRQGDTITRDLIDAAPLSPNPTPITVRKICKQVEGSAPHPASQKVLTDVTVRKSAPAQAIWAPEVPAPRRLAQSASPLAHTAWTPQAPRGHKVFTPKAPQRHRPLTPQAPRHHNLAQPSARKIAVTQSISTAGARRGTAPITVRKLRPTIPVIVRRDMHLRTQGEKEVTGHE